MLCDQFIQTPWVVVRSKSINTYETLRVVSETQEELIYC